MSWTVLIALVIALGVLLASAAYRRFELLRMQRAVDERERLRLSGSEAQQFQHPLVNLSRCMGCATCVAVCPETGVLEIVHGQAVVVNGTGCLGISACERECPVGAITVTIKNYAERDDIPALSPSREAVGTPGLFLAGEVTAQALIQPAIEQGVAVAQEVARRVACSAERSPQLDLLIVGAGPAGLACALEAKQQGLRYLVLDQQPSIGGTVATYPRRKLVLTQPVNMPGYGQINRTTYEKEELIDLWQGIARDAALDIRSGEEFLGLERNAAGGFNVRTQAGVYEAPNVCLAIGRRGTPRKLGVPGEELSKVAFSLIDAASYSGRRLLVVGGGDTAVETAMALAKQPGNQVTLSYRRGEFNRIKVRNAGHLERAVQAGEVNLLLNSELVEVQPGAVNLRVNEGGTETVRSLPNDEVFVMIGGIPPVKLLEESGVSFDPALRPPPRAIVEQGTGIVAAVAAAFLLSLLTLAFALWNGDYYSLPALERPAHDKHMLLRPSLGVGLGLGIAAAVLIVVNLLYLLRRSPGIRFQLWSLRAWMTSHVATGVLAFLCALLHAAMSPGDTIGGHALWSLGVLLITGAIGRYFYAWVPHAANGRELELREIKAQLGSLTAERGVERSFESMARIEVLGLIQDTQWKSGFFGRVAALFNGERQLKRSIKRIEADGKREDVSPVHIRQTVVIAKRAYRTAMMAAHFEDLRGVLGTWRYLHRWVAALMVILVVTHIIYALSYASFSGPGGSL